MAAQQLAASANGSATSDASQRQKRARTSKPKVKTGCSNCKQRRIKCDEKRPACTQCVRAKKDCTGYPPPARSARPFEEIRIAPKPSPDAGSYPPPGRQPIHLLPRRVAKASQRRITPPPTPGVQNSSMILYSPSTNLPFDQQESQYFQLFREQTASELSGFFDSVFWTKSVLQECHSESAIRHAVVALGALYKTLEKSAESPPGSPSNRDLDPTDNPWRHWEVAIKQYSHACNSLLVVNSQDTRMQRNRLMACILLTCFDSFIGDHRQAIVQIQNGLGLLEQLRAERRRAFMPKPEEPVEEELIQMFTRLAIQAKSYDMAFHFPHPYVIRLTGNYPSGPDPTSPVSDASSPVSVHQDPIPEQFASLLEARLAWDALLERALRFTETLFSYSSSKGPMGVLPSSMKQFGTAVRDQITAWSDAFDHILGGRTAPGVSSQEKAGIAVLKMSQIMGHILFYMTFSDSEMHFDNFLPYFKKIVDLALEVVGDEERRAAAKRCPDPLCCPHRHDHAPDLFGGHEYSAYHIKPSFSADLGIVPPLFVVATKCRNPIVRRQAIQLLRSSARREGMWDSELTARIGMWVADIEEEEDPAAIILTPERSPETGHARPVAVAATVFANGGSLAFGDDVPLGPGGNARWDARRESTVASLASRARRTVPEEKRVMVKAVEFDLRQREAVLLCGSRGLPPGIPDLKERSTKIKW